MAQPSWQTIVRSSVDLVRYSCEWILTLRPRAAGFVRLPAWSGSRWLAQRGEVGLSAANERVRRRC
eukprot:1150188-Rhodomonas_salina.1